MAKNPIHSVAAILLVSTLLAPTLAAAASDDDAKNVRIPWVPRAVPPDPGKPRITNYGAPGCLPAYPRSSRLKEEQGTVHLLFKVAKDGKLISASVTESSGSQALDDAALQGLSSCIFKPGMVDGQPIVAELQSVYIWKLED